MPETEQQERESPVWNRGVKLWELTVATCSLLIVIGGGLVRVVTVLYDIQYKVGTVEKLSQRVYDLELWKQQSQESQHHEERRISSMESNMVQLSQTQASVAASLAGINARLETLASRLK